MALDLKPLTQEVIQSMGFTTHDLWEVKIEGEIFGPFEVVSLRDYASENEKQFYHAQATRMDSDDWQPFFSITELKKVSSTISEDRYWVLEQGQKVGPITTTTIEKKIEMGVLSLADEVSIDDGHTWVKLYQIPIFNPVIAGGVESLPHTPQEASFQKAKIDLKEKMGTQDRSGPNAELAGLVFMGKNEATVTLNLDEMDLKSLNQTQVSRSLLWAVPVAFASLAAIGSIGYYLITPSAPTDVEVVQAEEKSEKVIIHKKSRVSMPSPEPVRQVHRAAPIVRREVPRPQPVHPEPAYQEAPGRARQERRPASYAPHDRQRSALTQAPVIHQNAYPNPEVETHFREPEPMNEQMVDGDNYQLSNEMDDHSGVGRPVLQPGATPSIIRGRVPARERFRERGGERDERESLDQSMGAYPEGDYPPEPPIVEEASDF